jgi:hypothetical protein
MWRDVRGQTQVAVTSGADERRLNRWARVATYGSLVFAALVAIGAILSGIAVVALVPVAVFVAALGLVGLLAEHRAAARRPFGALRPPAARPDFRSNPNRLLEAAYGVAPFRGRLAELDRIATWCDSAQSADIALVTGEGGRGKTRLALQICKGRTEGSGKSGHWITGFLRPPEENPDLTVLLHTKLPLLVVVDYAETRADQVVELVRHFCGSEATEEPGPQRRWRVLLLARVAGDW